MGPVRLIGCGAGHVCSMDTKHYRVIGARADPIVHPMNRPQSAATREEILGRTRRGRGAWEGMILLRPLNKGAPVVSDAFLSALSPFHGTGKTSKSKDDSSFVVESPLRLPIELSQTFHPVLLEHVRRLSSTGPTLPLSLTNWSHSALIFRRRPRLRVSGPLAPHPPYHTVGATKSRTQAISRKSIHATSVRRHQHR